MEAIFKVFHGTYNNKKISIDNTHDSPLVMLVPLVFLSLGAIFSGYLFKSTFIGHHSNEFWQGSIFFLNEIKHDAIPLWFLLTTPVLVLISIPVSFYFYILNPKLLEDFKNTNIPLYNFLLNKWYIDELYEKVFVNLQKKLAHFFGKKETLVL